MILTDSEIDNIHPMDKSFPVWKRNFAREVEAAVFKKIGKRIDDFKLVTDFDLIKHNVKE